jgi:hypothetical protein
MIILPTIAAVLSREFIQGGQFAQIRTVFAFFLGGIFFSNPVYAQSPPVQPPVDAAAGDNITVLGGTFPPITGVPVVLFAHDGGMIQTQPALTITALGVTGAGITNGGKITITDATFIDVATGLQIGIGIGPENGGTIEATDLKIVLGPGGANGATAIVPDSTITLHGGSIESAPR